MTVLEMSEPRKRVGGVVTITIRERHSYSAEALRRKIVPRTLDASVCPPERRSVVRAGILARLSAEAAAQAGDRKSNA